jgi:hypothetical protein
MQLSFLTSYRRSMITSALLSLALWLGFSGVRIEAWEALLPVFEWMETTVFGVIGKTWGAAYAVVEAAHLLAMALLGGAILISDGRLLGLVLRDVPIQMVLRNTHHLFIFGLSLAVASGIFLACGVATKIYYLPVYWFKMLALAVGVLFTFLVKRPLLADGIESLSPFSVRAVALASLLVWFTVAATGRWIGFSG